MKPRPTDAEFDELKRKRDESVRKAVERICAEEGWVPAKTSFHQSNMGPCYCACPDGPCQHLWDGPVIESHEEGWASTSCSRCGTTFMHHDMRCGPCPDPPPPTEPPAAPKPRRPTPHGR